MQEKTTRLVSTSSGPLEPSWANFLKYDGPAGLVVFLVAMPLCLGIALASGAPLFSGIIGGIVGGLVVGFLSSSPISVTGPAAALAVVVLSAIQTTGSFRSVLTAVVLAGGMQVLLGVAGAGVIGDYVPNSVIKGMLAGIGLVIILKQIPHALGRDKDFEGDFSFFEAGGSNTFSDVVSSIMNPSEGAVVIALVCLFVLIAWDRWSASGSRVALAVPGPLLAVLLGIGMNYSFGIFMPSWQLTDPAHMVQLPTFGSLELLFPDFASIGDPRVWTIALSIAILASIQTLLSIEAADRIDPFRRITSPNRELVAQGIGNIASGMVGGLPVSAVVLRTTANISSGGRTKISTIFHGLLLLFAVVAMPQYLNWTPLASLAAVLILVGYKLSTLKIYRAMYRLGWEQFLPFVLTVFAILFTDLLQGVVIGLVVGILVVIWGNHRAAISVVNQDNWYLMRFNKDMTFVNKSELRTKLNRIPEGTTLLIDGTKSSYIDRDIYEVIEDFQRSAPYKNVKVEIKRIEDRWR